MVTRRLMDGQLDECELTLQEVHQIEMSLVKNLCGLYHSRVSYPMLKGQRPSAAELLAARRMAEKQPPYPSEPPAPSTPSAEDA